MRFRNRIREETGRRRKKEALTHWLLEEKDHVIKSNHFPSKKQTFIELLTQAEH